MEILSENSLCQVDGDDSSSMEVLIPKKVRFRDKIEDVIQDMMVDPSSTIATS